MVEGRARSAKERRLEAAHKMGLLEEPDHVRALVAPWQLPKGEDRISKLLGLDETSDGEEGEGEGEDAAETLHSTRLLNAEASRLGVPLTSEPYKKLRRFSDSLSELSASLCFSLSASSENVLSDIAPHVVFAEHALLPAVKAKMDELLPDVQWKLKDVGKVYLARHLAEEFNKHKMFLNGPDGTLIEKPHRFDAYPKLTPALQKVYVDTFGHSSAAVAADMAQEVTKLLVTADTEVTKPKVTVSRQGRPPKRSRPTETRLDNTWSFGDGADIGSSSTEPALTPCPSLVLPIPSQCLLTSWVCLSRLSHERRLIIRPPYYTHRLCTQVPSKAVMRHTEDGSRFRHGRGPRENRWCKHGQHAAVSASTGEGISSGRRRKHRRGQHAAAETRAQTRASGVGHSRAHVQCVCVCVYPTAVGRTVPAREVGTSRSMGHSGMAVPM